MVDHLNTANRQSLPIDIASSLRKLEAILTQGQPRTAQVVQVTAQPQASTAVPAQATTTPSGASQQGAAQPGTPPTTAAATPVGTPTHPSSQSATTPQPPSSTELFRIQIRLEGRLFELITQKPLPPGTEVQISKDSGNRISLQLVTTGQQAQVKPADGKASSNPTANPTNATTQNTATQIRAVQVSNAATAAPSQRAASAPSINSSASTQAATQSLPPSVAQSTAQAAAQSTAQPAIQPNNSGHSSSNPATVERVPLQSLKTELPIKAGQRVSAEVVSSRPNPAALAARPTTQGGTALNTSQTATTTSNATLSTTAAITTATADSQLIRINVQGQRVELTSPRPLPPGSELQLVRDSKGQLWAELPTAKTQAIEQVLREHLPQQQSPAPLLNLLNSSQASGQLQQAKPLLLNLINLLTGRSLSSPQQANAESVKQQVQNSGTLLESKLAQGDTRNLGQDHKALLLRLAHQLGQPSTQSELPKTLSEQITQQTQQALSRVLVNQITSSLSGQAQETGSESNRTLALDMPIAWQDKTENLQLKIQRESSGTNEETGETEYRWRIRLNFEIDQSKILEAELTLEQNRVSVIWSGDRAIRNQVESQPDQLQQRLEDVGLEVQTLGVRDNLPDTDTMLKAPRNQLIDIKT